MSSNDAIYSTYKIYLIFLENTPKITKFAITKFDLHCTGIILITFFGITFIENKNILLLSCDFKNWQQNLVS